MKTNIKLLSRALAALMLLAASRASAQSTANTHYGLSAQGDYPNNNNYNSAFGYASQVHSNTGTLNTAIGAISLVTNLAGVANTAVGYAALYYCTAANNTAVGAYASQNITTGGNNVTLGCQAGYNVTTGSNNIALGYQAGYNVTTGNSNNIHIGHAGVSGDTTVIRIGTPGTHSATYLTGTVRIAPKGDLLMGGFATGTMPQ